MKNDNIIKIKLVAYTDAAGKFTPEAPRGGNEDNFLVNDNLEADTITQMKQDEIIDLSSLGVLMVVADGMGGLNAGEVASQVAIDVVRDSFVKSKLTETVTLTADSRTKYMERVIKAADKAIKLEARNNPEHEGMGSTIIMGWLYGNELTISWCGDSRAYLYNDKNGIRLISQDHSYVQELVNKGVLTYVQTFDHPQNNIVTRSLGDPTKDAKPDSKTIKVEKGDIILLCSDGLSGVLRDRKTFDEKGRPFPEQNLEDIIRAHTSSMRDCRVALWEAAEKEGWYDNVTAIICQIVEGPTGSGLAIDSVVYPSGNKMKSGLLKWLFLILALIIAIGIFCFFLGRTTNEVEEEKALEDTIKEQVDLNNKDKIISPNDNKQETSSHIIQNEKPNESIETKKDNSKQTTPQSETPKNESKPDATEESPSSELTLIKSNTSNDNDKLTPIPKGSNPSSPQKKKLENPEILKPQ